MTWVKSHRDGFRQKIKESWRELWRHVRAWSLFHTVIVMILICLAALAGAWCLWSWWAHIWSSRMDTTVNLDTVSLATVGGLGGLVALIVAYRKQAMNERNEADGKLTDAVHLLGEDKPSTRIAGVYALVNVGERYPELRQQIIDIFSGYLRTKREDDGPTESTIINALKTKLNKESWAKDREIDIDLHDVVLTENIVISDIKIHDLNLRDSRLNGIVLLSNSTFNGDLSLQNSTFNGSIMFGASTFNGSVMFGDPQTKNSVFNRIVLLSNSTFNGPVMFDNVTFNGEFMLTGSVFNNIAHFSKSTIFHSGTTADDLLSDAVFHDVQGIQMATFNSGHTDK